MGVAVGVVFCWEGRGTAPLGVLLAPCGGADCGAGPAGVCVGTQLLGGEGRGGGGASDLSLAGGGCCPRGSYDGGRRACLPRPSVGPPRRQGGPGAGGGEPPTRRPPSCAPTWSPARAPTPSGPPTPQVWRQITARVGHALKELERRAPRNVDQVPRDHAGERRRASEGALPSGPAGEEVAAE